MLILPKIDPIALHIGPLSVHWYGLMYLLGFASAWWLGTYRCQKSNTVFTVQNLHDFIFHGAIGIIIGGRIGYVIFYNAMYYIEHPLKVFALWDGGMSFHGGFMGVLFVCALYAKKLRLSWIQITDFIAPFVPPGLAFGRIGNFINGELWGRASNVPWAVVFPQDPQRVARHPSQLYEFILEGILLFLLLWCYSNKPRPTGATSALFLLGYGISRFVIEFFRQPDPQIGFASFGWMTRGQQLCIPMIVIGFVMLWYAYRKRDLHKT